jgi:hypothetical protein
MTARALWKGTLVLGKHEVPVKMYSAVQDRAVHFHLLHGKDLTPVEQRIVRKDDGREVPKEAQRKAFPLDDGRAVILEPDELERLAPEDHRRVRARGMAKRIPRAAARADRGQGEGDQAEARRRQAEGGDERPRREPARQPRGGQGRKESCLRSAAGLRRRRTPPRRCGRSGRERSRSASSASRSTCSPRSCRARSR